MPSDPSSPPSPANWSPALVGFYVSCAAVSIGAAIAAIVLIVFPEASLATPVAVFGVLLTGAGCVGAWRSLHAARRE